jgi:hypothetical protein
MEFFTPVYYFERGVGEGGRGGPRKRTAGNRGECLVASEVKRSVDGPGELTDSPPVGRVIVLQGHTGAIRHLKTAELRLRCQIKNSEVPSPPGHYM